MNRQATVLMPDLYREIPEEELEPRIREHKARLGKRLVILAHHYQRPEIVALGDFVGDSYALSRDAARQTEARDIVFCGVHFMAESAEILASPDQRVSMPDLQAGCPMANMAEIGEVERAWDDLGSVGGQEGVIPITYINSHAELKAFCGRHGGAVCTSANAGPAFKWGFRQEKRIFFFPDEHLGRNTANALGISHDDAVVYDPEDELGGLGAGALARARVILWKGYCHVHTHFRPEHVHEVRRRHPGVKVVVHPECTEDVVALSDGVGSTGFIVRYVEEARPGATIAIGTELNLVRRLATEHPEKKIFELARSLCPNMFRIDLRKLLWTLDHLGEVNLVTVPEAVAEDARRALERMLEIGESGVED
jgi:quinolinate synthase